MAPGAWRAMPLAPVALAFAAGIALAPLAGPALGWAGWLAGAGAATALLALGRPRAAAAALLVAVLALGIVRATPPPPADDDVTALGLPRTAWLEGRLAAEPVAWTAERARLLLDVAAVDGVPRRGLVQVALYGPRPPLTDGQRIALEARLARATGFRNPGVFDHGAYLARRDIRVVATARADAVRALDDPAPPWPVAVKRHAVEALGRALPPASAALLTGLLLGDRAGLPAAIQDAFRRAGVYHVLAVSGSNVALIAAAVWILLRLLGLGRRSTALAAIGVVVAFGLVVGADPSVLRAVVMAVLVLAALLLDREASVTNSLALAAIVILAARPNDLHDPGFQLSFAATAGILAAPLPRGRLASVLAVSVAAQLAVLPVGLAHFNQLTTIGVLANLVVVPLTGVVTVLGLAAVALDALSAVAARVALDAAWPMLLAMRAAVWLAALVPGATVHLPAPPWAAIVAYGAALALARRAWSLRAERPRAARRALGGAVGLVAVAVGLAAWPLARPADGRLHVAVLDVGDGDAVVVRAPDGQTVLLGPARTGLRPDIAARVVAPFLWNAGVRRLAAVVADAPDAEPAALAALARLVPVGERLDPAALAREPRWLGGARLSAAAPDGGRAELLRLELGLVSFLVSDAEAAGEAALLHGGAPLAATVLRVARQGGAQASTEAFLAAVQPLVAVVSVGARDRHGRPASATLERLAARGAAIARTDADGAVLLETDGRALTVTRWASRRTTRHCLDPETIC